MVFAFPLGEWFDSLVDGLVLPLDWLNGRGCFGFWVLLLVYRVGWLLLVGCSLVFCDVPAWFSLWCFP